MIRFLDKHYGPVIRNSTMRRLCLSNFITQAGATASLIAIPLIVLQITNAGSPVAFTMMASALGVITGSQFLYKYFRKIHPAKIVATTECLLFAATLIIVGLSFLPHFEWTVVVMTYVAMIFQGIWRNSVQVILKETAVSTDEELTESFNAAHDLTSNFGAVFGPLFASLLFLIGDARLALAMNGLTYLISGWILLGIKFKYHGNDNHSLLKTLKNYPKAKLIGLLSLPFLIQVALAINVAAVVVHLVKSLSASPSVVSIVEAMSNVALFFGILIAPSVKNFRFIMPIGVAFEALGFFGMYLATGPWQFSFAQMFFCVGLGVSANMLRSSLQRMCKKEEIATVMAFRITIIQLAQISGMGLVAVWLLTSTTSSLYLIAAILLSVASLYAFIVDRKVNLTRRPVSDKAPQIKINPEDDLPQQASGS